MYDVGFIAMSWGFRSSMLRIVIILSLVTNLVNNLI